MKSTTPNKRIWLATPTMHGEEMKYMTQAYEAKLYSTLGAAYKGI